MNIRISKASSVPLRQQIAAQIEYQIATGKLRPGDPLPSVRALARQLRIHKNTVSKAYHAVTSVHLLSAKRGSRLVVRTPEERAISPQPDLDDLINQTIRLARRHGYSLQHLSARVRERLMEEPPDHVLAIAFEEGVRRLTSFEIQRGRACRVDICSPQELVETPERAMGALVVAPPGVLPSITGMLSKHQPVIPILYSPAEPHLDMVRQLKKASIVAVASVSEYFLMVACGLLAPATETKHTLIDCLWANNQTSRIPAADLLFCDAIVFDHLRVSRRDKNAIAYNMISTECHGQIAGMLHG